MSETGWLLSTNDLISFSPQPLRSDNKTYLLIYLGRFTAPPPPPHLLLVKRVLSFLSDFSSSKSLLKGVASYWKGDGGREAEEKALCSSGWQGHFMVVLYEVLQSNWGDNKMIEE